MLDPMTIAALIGAGSQAAAGLGQLFSGMGKDAPQTPYQIPQEIKDILAQAQGRTTQGLPSQSLGYYQDMAQRASATGLRNLSTRSAGISGLAGIAQAEMDSGRQLAVQDAERRIQSEMANQAALQQAQQLMAQYKDRAFDITRQREDLAAQEKGALIGSGLQNIMGGVQSGLGTFAQGQYLKTLQDKNAIDQKALDAALTAKKTAAPMGPELPSDFVQTPYQTGSYADIGPNIPGTEPPLSTVELPEGFVPDPYSESVYSQMGPNLPGIEKGVARLSGGKIGVPQGAFMSGYKNMLNPPSQGPLSGYPYQGTAINNLKGVPAFGETNLYNLPVQPKKYTDQDIQSIISAALQFKSRFK